MQQTGHILNGRYQVERVLGQGGMGAVYLAWQPDLDARVAIKEMAVAHMEPALREAFIAQFRAEARILNRLHHPNLPRVYDFFEEDDRQFLVMDFIDGTTLDQMVSSAPATEAQALQWARELCEVLGYLHGHNPPVIFKDLKPTNVMVARDGTIRLIDFGIARMDSSDGSTATVLKGTVSDGFAPVEQYGAGRTDARTDLYALGATLYCVLSRHIPPPAPDRIGSQDPLVPLQQLRPDLSERMATTVEWLLQVNRDARPRSVQEVVEALGLTPATGPAPAAAPAAIRRLIREEFHHFFPAPRWFERDVVHFPTILEFMGGTAAGSPAPMVGIYGQAGAGKSRLMQELRQQCKASRTVLPLVRGMRLWRTQPFGALLPAMRKLLRGPLVGQVAAALDPQVLQEASAALPELRPLVSEKPGAGRTSADQTRSLLTALTEILAQAALAGPLLLPIDDVHWLDAATVRFLDQLRSQPIGEQVALMLAFDPYADDGPHQKFLETWNVEGQVLLVDIPPLLFEEVEPYLNNLLPPIQGPPGWLRDLHGLTRGNPLLLESLLRLMVSRRILREHQGSLRLEDWHPDRMPRQLGEAVRRRIEHLPLDSQMALAQGAVVGMTFTLGVLQELSGESETVLREALQRAREQCFVQPAEDGGYSFLAEAAQQAFYERLPAVDRARLHRTLAIMEEDRCARTGEVGYSELHYAMAGELDATLEGISRMTTDFLSPRSIELVLGAMPDAKTWDTSSSLKPEQERKAIQALGMLTRTTRSKGSFGAQAMVAGMAQESLQALLLPLLTETGPLTVTCTPDGLFTLNGHQLSAAQAPPDLAGLLSRHKLSGFQLRPGMARDELKAFVDLLGKNRESIQDGGGWTEALARAGITHATMSETIYVGVSETELFDPAKLKEFGTISVRESRPEEAPAEAGGDMGRVEQMLESVRDSRASDATVLARLDAIRELLDTLKRGTEAPAAVVVQTVAAEPSRPDVPPEILELAQELCEQAHPAEVVRLLSLVRNVEAPLADFLRMSPDHLLQTLETTEDANVRIASVAALTALSRKAVPAIIRFLATSDHQKARQEALFVLRKLASDADVLLTRRALEGGDAGETCRLLLALEAGRMPWTSTLNVLIQSSLADVRKSAWDFFQKSSLSAEARLSILDEIIRSDHPGVVADGLRMAGKLRLESLIPAIVATLKRTFDRQADTIQVHREACHALGRIGTPQVLAILKPIVFPPLTQLALKRDPEVRSAALWGIARVPGWEAEELVQRGAVDKDPLIRSVAKVAIETRTSQTTSPEVMAEMEE